MQYRDDGYLPEALLNYGASGLGSWRSGNFQPRRDDRSVLSELCEQIRQCVNTDKLLWLNHHYINTMPPEYVATYLQWHIEQANIDTRTGPELADW